jgi:signal transduction histidine kinase
MYTLATIYNEQQKYADAERILKQALTMCEGRHFWPVYSLAGPIYKQLYVVYAAQKDYHKAYLYADSAMIANDSLAAQTNTLTLAKAHDQLEYTRRKLESEKLQNQINNAKIEISKNRIIMLFAISGIGILLVVVLFIIRLNNKVNNQKKELEKLNAVKDRIFSIIGHDLRAPVNSVVSFTQLLEHGDIPPEKLQKYAGVLKDTLGHTVTLMENLLNWARTQMQGYNPVFEQFDLAETAMQCMALLTPDADKKKIAIINNITEGAIISSDFNMVSLLVRNLLSNAIKYTPPGGIIILSAIVAANKVQIKVKDTGVGIAPALVHNFNKSASVQPLESTPGTNKEKGTGLGLMLCKDFASLMRGKITLESEPGKGSCFVVELPT